MRSMGIETEYGIIAPDRPSANPVDLSTAIVRSYAAQVPHAPWDYAGEDPLNDARGYRISRMMADASQLTDQTESGLRLAETNRLMAGGPANAVLTNGARLYVDHAHPEYSGPEVTSARHAVIYDRAGDEIMREAMAITAAAGNPILIYKNNTDGKGASYGTHENYLVKRSVPFDELASYLTPFFVTRPIVVGAGRVGQGQESEEPGFQISQRADYIENDIGLETTFNRPIINTRDEPHADAYRYRRLHVIVGDANSFDVPNYLKFATTDLVLALLEAGLAPLELDAITLSAPVVDAWGVSHDPFDLTLSVASGRTMTALDIQRLYFDLIVRHRDEIEPRPDLDQTLELWDRVLTGLATDPESVVDSVEWLAKQRLMDGMRLRWGSSWDDPRLAAMDLQWADLRPERSVVERLDAAGAVRRLVTQEEIHHAVTNPPEDTRAYFRGRMVSKGVAAAGWSSVVIDSAKRGRYVRIPLNDPLRATRERTSSLLDHDDLDAIIDQLSTPGGYP